MLEGRTICVSRDEFGNWIAYEVGKRESEWTHSSTPMGALGEFMYDHAKTLGIQIVIAREPVNPGRAIRVVNRKE